MRGRPYGRHNPSTTRKFHLYQAGKPWCRAASSPPFGDSVFANHRDEHSSYSNVIGKSHSSDGDATTSGGQHDPATFHSSSFRSRRRLVRHARAAGPEPAVGNLIGRHSGSRGSRRPPHAHGRLPSAAGQGAVRTGSQDDRPDGSGSGRPPAAARPDGRGAVPRPGAQRDRQGRSPAGDRQGQESEVPLRSMTPTRNQGDPMNFDKTFRRARLLATPALAALLVAACATVTPIELTNARTAYGRASAGPAAQYTPVDLHKARVALDKAEQNFAAEKGTQKTIDLA